MSNTRKSVSSPRFSMHFSVFGYLMKDSSLCLIYYFKFRLILRELTMQTKGPSKLFDRFSVHRELEV